MKRLSLRPYNRWRRAVPQAARGAADADPLGAGAHLRPRPAAARGSSRATQALAIGSAAEPAAYLLAAYDAVVTFLAGDLGCVERVESRMATEALGSMFEGYVAQAAPSAARFRRHPWTARPRGAGSRRPERSERRLPHGIHRRPAAAQPAERRPRDPRRPARRSRPTRCSPSTKGGRRGGRPPPAPRTAAARPEGLVLSPIPRVRRTRRPGDPPRHNDASRLAPCS